MDNDASAPKSTITVDAPRRKPRGFKIALIILAALVILFALFIYLLPNFLPIGTIKSIAQSKARDMAGVDLDFGNLRFGWNGDVVIDDITVAPLGPDGAPGETLLTIKEARTNVALMPLLSGKAIVNSVEVNGFAATVRREADGTLNLPDFSRLSQQADARVGPKGRSAPMLLSAPAEAPVAALPPIEIHRLDLNKGMLTYQDAVQNLSLDVGLDFLHVEGKNLEEPFVLSGRLIPYPENAALGDLPFTGRVAMLRNGELNLDGEATLEAKVVDLSLHEMAAKFGMGDLVRSARANGAVNAHYADRSVAVDIPELHFSDTSLGLGGDQILAVPDSTAEVNAKFDPEPGSLSISNASITNDIVAVRAQGIVDGLNGMAQGGLPSAVLDFSGSADFARASHYASTQGLGLEGLPELDGKASFIGKAVLPAQEPGGALSPSVTVDFNDGNLQALENNTGIIVVMDLKGLGVHAAAALGQETEVTAGVNLANVPGRSFVPQLGHEPVSFTLGGAAAFSQSSAGTVAEVRLENTRATIPATPWSAAATVHNAQGRLRYDMNQDHLQIDGLSATVNDAIEGGVVTGTVTGIMAGRPNVQADLELSTVLEKVKELLAPVFPHELAPQLAGNLRGAARLKVEGDEVEALMQGELDDSHGVLAPTPDAQAEFRTPKTNIAVRAGLSMGNPGAVTVHSFEATAADTSLRCADTAGSSLSGSVGRGLVKAAGVIDTTAGLGNLSVLSVDVNGMNLAIGRDGQQIASLASGLMQAVAAAPGKELHFPLAGQGDFALANLDLGVDDLIFRFKDEESRFGNVRVNVVADGYVGPDKKQQINLNTASLQAAPIRLNSRGALDLGTGEIVAAYAARMAPAGISSLLGFLGLPPSLLSDATVNGNVYFNGSRVDSKGEARGSLQTGTGAANPFEMVHDLSAAWNPADRSLALAVRRLDGSVKTADGQPVATMGAQQSQLLLSRAGSKGLLDVRFNGSAGPTRTLLLGLAGVVPQLSDLANTLHQAQADGVYNAWVQVRDLDPTTLSVNVGGVWQGAALTIGNTPYLAEAAKLSANLVGEVAYQNNQVRLSRLFLRSDSGMMQADGTAVVSYTADENNLPTGFGHLEVDTRFVMADLSRAALVFPGVFPGGLGVTGRIDGELKAGGDASNIDIAQCVVNFQQFQAKPSPDLDVAIPNGRAVLGGNLSLHMNGRSTGSPYDALTMLDFRNGSASLQGMEVRGKAVNEMGASFQLEGGVLTLNSARLSIGGGQEGSVQAAGRVDFTSGEPAVVMRMAMQNIPLAEANSEIADYMQFMSGAANIPAQQGQSFAVSFVGLSEDDILRTLSLENFNFATGQVVMETGPVLNAELDKARGIMRQNRTSTENRRITFSRIEGTATADGSGTINFPDSAPINLIGEDTGDFRARGYVTADHTMDMKVMVAGKLENIIGFTIPSIIPQLASDSSGTGNRLMDAMNESAAKGKYGVHVKGSLAHPDISGIGALAGQFLQDMLRSEVLGGILNLGKDAPQAVLNLGEQVVGGLLNPTDTLKNAPGNIVRTPENVVKGLGQMFGLTPGNQQQQRQQQQNPQQGGDEEEYQQQQQPQRPKDAVKDLGRMFGIGRREKEE